MGHKEAALGCRPPETGPALRVPLQWFLLYQKTAPHFIRFSPDEALTFIPFFLCSWEVNI